MNLKSYDLTKCKGTRDKLKVLRDTYGLKWSQILKIYPFSELPPQTLSMIYHGKRGVPKKYCELLGEPVKKPAPVCTACGDVHNIDRACEKQVVLKEKRRPQKRQAHRFGWLLSFYSSDEVREMLRQR